MRIDKLYLLCLPALAALSAAAVADTEPARLTALKGLAPVSALPAAPLAVNQSVTDDIQNGVAPHPTLLPFPEQQRQALSDAFITSANAAGLADGLGSKLGAAYRARAKYTSADDGKTTQSTNLTDAVAALIAVAYKTAAADAGAGKFFFANGTTDGKTPVEHDALDILMTICGTIDVFGKAYGLPAGTKGADIYGNSRPFQTTPHLLDYAGKDYFGVDSKNTYYLYGPAQKLVDSPSYPSGHTTYGYTESLVLALLVPARYGQMVVRGAEYGDDRIIIGAHYAMDVLGGRTLASYDLAQLLAGTPGYGDGKIGNFAKALDDARTEATRLLENDCGGAITACAKADTSRFADPARNARFYESTQTYGLPVVFKETAKGPEDVAKLAPEAGWLLKAAFPALSLAEADAILTQTEGPGGGFLDNGSAFGVYSRLDLYRASEKARTLAPAAR